MANRRILNWRALAIAMVILAVSLALAGRVVHGNFGASATVSTVSHVSKFQRFDLDASEWVPAPATFSLLWLAEDSVTPECRLTVPARLLFKSLYNRPPPVS